MDKDMEHLIGTSLASSLGVLAKPLIDAAAREGYAQAIRDVIEALRGEGENYWNEQAVFDVRDLATDKGIDLSSGQPQDT